MEEEKLLLVYSEHIEDAARLVENFVFSDNGGEPDGNAYLAPVSDIEPSAAVDEILARGWGEIVDGYSAEYPRHYHHIAPLEAQLWCGYQVNEVVYFTV